MPRILCVTAHPDDEAAAFGGTLRLYHERGAEIYLICLTPGQAATHRGTAKSDHELAAIRRKELAASCEILGIDRWIVLDYADGQLHRVELLKVVGDVVRGELFVHAVDFERVWLGDGDPLLASLVLKRCRDRVAFVNNTEFK